jgi:hypothetical protein
MSLFPDGLAKSLLVDTFGFSETTITFQVASGSTSTDSDSGNVIQPTTDLSVKVALSPSSNVQQTIYPGAERFQIAFVGNVTDVDTNYVIPATVKAYPRPIGTCTWDGKAGDIELDITGHSAATGIGERFTALFTPKAG